MKIEATQLISRSVASQLQPWKNICFVQKNLTYKLVHEFTLEDNTSKQRLNYVFLAQRFEDVHDGMIMDDGHYVHPDAPMQLLSKFQLQGEWEAKVEGWIGWFREGLHVLDRIVL